MKINMINKLILCILALALGTVPAVEASAAETQTAAYSSDKPNWKGYKYFKTVTAYTFEYGTDKLYQSIMIDIYRNVKTGAYVVYCGDPTFGPIVYKSDRRGYAYMCKISGFDYYFNIQR